MLAARFRIAASTSVTWCRTAARVTDRSRRDRPGRRRCRPVSSSRFGARTSTIGRSRSKATTWPQRPTRSASQAEIEPLPQPTSTARAPGPTPGNDSMCRGASGRAGATSTPAGASPSGDGPGRGSAMPAIYDPLRLVGNPARELVDDAPPAGAYACARGRRDHLRAHANRARRRRRDHRLPRPPPARDHLGPPVCFPDTQRLDRWCAENGRPEAIVAGFFLRDPWRPLGEVRIGGEPIAHDPVTRHGPRSAPACTSTATCGSPLMSGLPTSRPATWSRPARCSSPTVVR